MTVPILFDDTEAPPLYHERYAPMWAACEANDMPVHVHGGAGPDYGDGVDPLAGIMLYVTEVPMWPKRILWFLLWNGTLERHPGLRLVFTEGTSDWVPAVGELPRLPLRVEGLRAHPRRAPEEAE